MNVHVGEVIDGKYRVERIINRSAMSIVAAVVHATTNERYALKLLLPDLATDDECVARFIREARAASRIESEHVARVSDVGELRSGIPYIVMELLEGVDLGALLTSAGPLPAEVVVGYILQGCAGVGEAHARGFVHRDLKPSNLFLTHREDGSALVKVLDFGIAKAVGESDAPHTPVVTLTHAVFGSVAYMSPEQIRSAKTVDYRTDVWALGVIAFELLTGRIPFDADTSGGILAAIVADEPPRLRDLRPDVDEALERVVSRCLEKDANRRFSSVADLALALEAAASERDSVVSVERIPRPAALPAATEETLKRANDVQMTPARTLPEIVQHHSRAGTTGHLVVTHRGRKGRLWFDRGAVCHAATASRLGPEAFHEIMRWSSGECQMHVGVRAPTRTIHAEWRELLLESFLRIDALAQRALASNQATQRWSNNDTEPPMATAEIRSVKVALTKLARMAGFIGAALVDSETGTLLSSEGRSSIDLVEMAAANSELLRAKRRTVQHLALHDETIEDIVISLDEEYHLIRPLGSRPELFFYVALDRAHANLASARLALASVERDALL